MLSAGVTRLLRLPVFLLILALLMVGCGANLGPKLKVSQEEALWTEEERRAVVAYWAQPGRYAVEPGGTPDRINVTTTGSAWYASFVAALNQQTPEIQALWRAWVDKQIAGEKATLTDAADGKTENKTSNMPMRETIPADLKESLGEPPAFYERTRPLKYTVTFAEADYPTPFTYVDNIFFADRKPYYQYYRSANGVMKVGKKVKDYEGADRKKLAELFKAVGRTESEAKVLMAVSALEGGFEAINTYDTGFVSIGFIQFITGREGKGSLGEVLARYKRNDFAAFREDFHRFGLDVSPENTVAVVDPTTGVEKRNGEAVRAIIDDKRLTAVLERAGMREGFRRAQVEIARERYWPGDDRVTVIIGGVQQTALVTEFVKSEAGLATLMDRKVNRGNIRLINEIAAKIVEKYRLSRLSELTKYERELIQQMKFRTDFLADPTLSKPK